MKTAMDQVKQLLENLPEDVSFEDIHYHIYVCQKIERGFDDISAGNVLSQEEVESRVDQWLEK